MTRTICFIGWNVLEADRLIEHCAERFDAHNQDARRLLHGRGQAYPGFEQINVDRYGNHILVSLFRRASNLEPQVAEKLCRALGDAFALDGVALQRRDGRKTMTEVLFGDVPEKLLVEENGLRFWVSPLTNQNTGFFLDMAPLRRRLAGGEVGDKVLNLFAYTCAFSVACVAGGATEVVNNDMSQRALDEGARNHRANEQSLKGIHMLPHNLFKSWWKIRQLGPYDTVIIDPPTNQKGSFVADRNYGQILKRLGEFTRPGSRVFACLNSPFHNADFLPGLMSRWQPNAQWVQKMAASPDFPDINPDRALKIYEYVMR